MKIPMIVRTLVILILSICWPTLLFAAPDYSKTPVFFVHGYGMSAGSFNTMISGLETSGYPTLYLRAIQLVPTDGANIAAAENQIAPAIETFLSEINTFLAGAQPDIPLKTKVDLVSHSMGGLSSRWYATKVRPDRVRKWISLAGANHGTNDVCPPQFISPGADDLCPAYANSAEESYIQYELNGAPDLADVDETPFGVGGDSAGVASIAPDSNRRILYVTIRTSPDVWIDPEDSVIVDGTGGIDIPIPSDVQAIQTGPGSFLMTNQVGHDPMLADDDTIKLVSTILELLVQNPVSADFTAYPVLGTTPLTVNFNDQSTGDITTWSWIFGDGDTSAEQSPTYTYDDPGTYTVTLEAEGPGGSDALTRTNYITVTEAQLQYTLTVNIVGEGSVTLDPGGGTYDAGTQVQLTPIPNAGWVFHDWSGNLNGYSNPASLVMSTDKTVTATFDVDSDADGISDAEEDAGPNAGDGNYDGIKDSDQMSVVSLHIQDGTNYVTLESGPVTTLASCRAVAKPTASGAPSGTTFPYDFFNFTINGVGPGGTATLTLYLPGETDPTTYWKYGGTPADANPHWYEFMYETATETGAEISGNIITLHFVDGERGDDVPVQDGMIIDLGGPGVSVSNSNGASTSGGGGGRGGCFISTATSCLHF